MKLLRDARAAKGLRVCEVAQACGIDQALICKFEAGQRIPTPAQAEALANLLSIPIDELLVARLTQKILALAGKDDIGLRAIRAAEAEISGGEPRTELPVEDILEEMDHLRELLLRRGPGRKK